MLYAPLAEVRLRGGLDFSGAVVGNEVDGNGGPEVHYDEDLGTEWQVETPYRLIAWREVN